MMIWGLPAFGVPLRYGFAYRLIPSCASRILVLRPLWGLALRIASPVAQSHSRTVAQSHHGATWCDLVRLGATWCDRAFGARIFIGTRHALSLRKPNKT